MASADIGDIRRSFFSSASAFDARFLGHVRSLDALFHLVQIGALFEVAEFLLDRLDLLVEVVLALALLHLLLDAPADALLDLEDVELGFHQCEQMLETLR